MTKRKLILDTTGDDAKAARSAAKIARIAAAREAEDAHEDGTSEIELPDMKDLEAEEKLAVFHQKFGGEDYKIRVETFNKTENEWEMVANLKLAGFDSFDSLKKYGAGRYRMSLLDTGGHYVAGGRMEARIAASAIEAEKAATIAAAPPAQDSAVLEMMKAQNAQNLALITALIGRPVTESKGPSLSELVATMAGLRNLAPKEEGGMGGVKGTLELMKLMKEIMPDNSGGGDDDSMLGELSKAVELFGKVSPLIEARRAAKTTTPPARLSAPPAPANLAASGAIAVPTPEPADVAEELDPMKPIIEKALTYVPQLVAWASRGKDIEDAAYFVIDELEAEIVPAIVKNFHPGGMTLSDNFVFGELIKRGQDAAQVEAIFVAAPALAPYKEWFTRVIAKAVEIALTPADAPEGGDHAEAA